MKTLFTIMAFFMFANLFGQDRKHNDIILFSENGDTILLGGFSISDTNGIKKTQWRVITRTADSDTITQISSWYYVSSNNYLGFDSLPTDSLEKYNLIKKGKRTDFKDIKDFKIDIEETNTNIVSYDLYDSSYTIKSCTVNFDVYYKELLIHRVDNFQTMYASKINEKINADHIATFDCWKMLNKERYLLIIRHRETEYKGSGSFIYYFEKWKII